MEEYKSLHSYSVRIDLSHNATNLKWILDNLEPDKYLLGLEIKPDSGCPHYQGNLFYKEKLEKRHLDKYKLRIRRNPNLLKNLKKGTKKQQQFSFTIARDPTQLLSYCNKQEEGKDGIVTNFKKSTIVLIPEWIDKKTLKKELQKTKKKALTEFKESLFKDEGVVNPAAFLNKMIDKYLEIYNSVPRYNTQLVWIYNFTNCEELKQSLRAKMSHGLNQFLNEGQEYYYNDYN